MKRRIIAIILASAILLSLSACSNNKDSDSESQPSSNSTASASDNELFGNDVSQSPSQTGGDDASESKNDSSTSKFTQSQTTAVQTVKVTVPEGTTLVKLSWILRDKGVCAAEDFIKAAENYSLSSSTVLADAASAPNLCFSLEGYLFPATYDFQKNSDPKAVIDKMVGVASYKITQQMKTRAAELGYNMHQIITLASIIEKEAKTAEQRTMISSVLHNRLKVGMKLQCDVTIKYCEGVIKVQYGQATMDKYKYYYNTERCKGLPAGPICNPGMASINAALYPDNSNNLYFVVTDAGALYAETYEQHKENCKALGLNA